MADKERFQKVNEIDLEALIDNSQEENNIYITNYPVNIFKDMACILCCRKLGEKKELSIY